MSIAGKLQLHQKRSNFWLQLPSPSSPLCNGCIRVKNNVYIVHPTYITHTFTYFVSFLFFLFNCFFLFSYISYSFHVLEAIPICQQRTVAVACLLGYCAIVLPQNAYRHTYWNVTTNIILTANQLTTHIYSASRQELGSLSILPKRTYCTCERCTKQMGEVRYRFGYTFSAHKDTEIVLTDSTIFTFHKYCNAKKNYGGNTQTDTHDEHNMAHGTGN